MDGFFGSLNFPALKVTNASQQPMMLRAVVRGVLFPFCSILVFAAGLSSQKFPVSELLALQSFYNSTAGWDWNLDDPYETYGYPWDVMSMDVNPCNLTHRWQGIVCDTYEDGNDVYDSVTYIGLDGHNLYGTLPSTMKDLPHLQQLHLTNNHIMGTIPAYISQLSMLVSLQLSFNDLTGEIPPEIGSLLNLQILDLSDNLHVRGALPDKIWTLTNLQSMYLSDNELSGTLSADIQKLVNLTQLNLNANHFTGTIAPEIGSIKQLETLTLSNNYFYGTLPSELGQLTMLSYLLLNDNDFEGPVFAWIGNLIKLSSLNLASNRLTGSIPDQIGDLINFHYFMAFDNLFTGSVPDSVYSLPLLQELRLGGNALTGTISSKIGQLSSLIGLYLGNTMLTGTIPSEITLLTYLMFLELGHCGLTGTLPDSLWDMADLFFVELEYNHLSGPIPSTNLNHIYQLQSLVLSNNHLTGTIPSDFGGRIYMFKMYFGNNYLTGGVPEEIGNMVNLQILELTSNFFTVSIPTSIQQLSKLVTLLLSNNRFVGPIATLLDNATMPALKFVDVSANALTGSLPSLRNIPKIEIFAAAVNCMRSEIPSDYCALSHLRTLVLDGLHAASSCMNSQTVRFAGYHSQPLDVSSSILGTIPKCLFSMASMTDLHLSGNGIDGTIPSDITQLGNLTDLSMSHNAFSGRIPQWIWSNPHWNKLDLSFNRLSGHLSDELVYPAKSNDSSLKLSLNRLSGNIPRTFDTVSTISLLNGNIFGCLRNRQSLPANDPLSESYSCGSDLVNNTLIVWTIFATVVAIVSAVVTLRWLAHSSGEHSPRANRRANAKHHDDRNLHDTTNDLDGEYLNNSTDDWMVLLQILIWNRFEHPAAHRLQLPLFAKDLRFIVSILARCLTALLVIGLPLYTALTAFFGVYETQYVWTVSACYLEGTVAATVMLLMLCGLLWYYDSAFRHRQLSQRPRAHRPTATNPSDMSSSSSSSILFFWCGPYRFRWDVMLVRFVFVATNTLVVAVVNGTYIYAIRQSLSLPAQALITLSLSLFKIAWGQLVVHHLDAIARSALQQAHATCCRLAPNASTNESLSTPDATSALAYHSNHVDRTSGSGTIDRYSGSVHTGPTATPGSLDKAIFGTQLTAAITVFNTVVIPYLAEMAIDPNCFFYLFAAAPPVQSQYAVALDCQYNPETGEICGSSIRTIDFQPAFVYNYLCSSSLVTSFAFVFLLRYLLSGLIIPVMLLTLQSLAGYLYRQRRTSPLCARLGPWLILSVLPWKYRPMEWIVDQFSGARGRAKVSEVGKESGQGDVHDLEDIEVMHPEEEADGAHRSKNTPLLSPSSVSFSSASSLQRPPLTSSSASKRWPKLQELVATKKEVVVRLVNDVALLLTYGILFPPVAVIVCAALVVDIVVNIKHWMRIQRLVTAATGARSIPEPPHSPSRVQRAPASSSSFSSSASVSASVSTSVSVSALEWSSGMATDWTSEQLTRLHHRYSTLSSTLFGALRTLPWLAALFWSFTLFDTLAGGHQQRAVESIWIVLLMCLAPLWMWCLERGLVWLVRRDEQRRALDHWWCLCWRRITGGRGGRGVKGRVERGSSSQAYASSSSSSVGMLHEDAESSRSLYSVVSPSVTGHHLGIDDDDDDEEAHHHEQQLWSGLSTSSVVLALRTSLLSASSLRDSQRSDPDIDSPGD